MDSYVYDQEVNSFFEIMRSAMSSIKMLLVAIATANYLSEAKQLFASAHDAGYWQGDYMLLTQGISAEDHLWYENRGILVREYEPVISEEEWSQSPSSTIYNKIVMERFHLFKEEFNGSAFLF